MFVAWSAMILWPLVCIVLYRSLALPSALCISIVGGYLLLPSSLSFDIPLLPPLHKDNIPTLAALVLTAIALRQNKSPGAILPGWLPRKRSGFYLLLLLLLGVVGTTLTNVDPLFYGPTILLGLTPYDGLASLINTLIMVVPLLLARKVLASPEGQRTLLVVLAISGVIYCFPALYEVRMSPQIHVNVYGYFPHSFLQAFRGGGFRPNVFLNHGLELSMFLVAALFAAIGIFRVSKTDMRNQFFLVFGLILATVTLVNSLGALAIALFVLPVALYSKVRTQIVFAACVATAVLTFPLLRSTGLVPTESIVTTASSVSAVRAGSLNFRFEHEDALLEKTLEKPLFGWGGWGRGRIFNEDGRDVSVIDGAWIAVFNTGGWSRYLAIFGLLCWPVVALLFTRRDNIDPVCAALALIMATKLLDLVPNGAMPPFIWLVAGALFGRLEMTVQNQAKAEPKLGYSRKSSFEHLAEVGDKPKYARTFSQPSDRPKPREKIRRDRRSRYSN